MKEYFKNMQRSIALIDDRSYICHMSPVGKHKEHKKQVILEEGMELIWKNGYNATGISEIVKAAQIPKGSFYYYFDSKEDFVVEVIRQYAEEHFEPAIDILENSEGSAMERLKAFYQFRIDRLFNDMDGSKGCLACNLANEIGIQNEKIRSTICSIHNKYQRKIADVVKQAQEEGSISKKMKPEDLVMFMEDAGKGAMISMKETKTTKPMENVMFFIQHLLFN